MLGDSLLSVVFLFALWAEAGLWGCIPIRNVLPLTGFVVVFATGSHFVIKAGPKFMILLLQFLT